MTIEIPPADLAPSSDPVPSPLRAAIEGRGYRELTAVQRAVAAEGCDGVDLRVSSQTGSGKTVAIGILLAQRLFQSDPTQEPEPTQSAAVRALVITPTRELAAQVQSELCWLYADLPQATVEVVTGGTHVGQEKRALRKNPSLVVGTPGRVLDHIRSGALDCSSIREVVLDEADQMLDMGFREELEGILDSTSPERGTHLVSATFPPEIQRLAERYQRTPRHVEGTRLGQANEDIEHVVHLVHTKDRYPALVNLLLLAENQRTLVFVNKRSEAAEIASQLAEDGFSAMPLSGELQQVQRTRTLAAFRDGMVNVLVATDVAARGLDIAQVDTIIQAGTPVDADVYVHRSGRTGRAGRKGRSVLLVPTINERRVRRLLAQTGIETSWCDIPSAKRVRKKLIKRGRRRLLQAIDGAEQATEAKLEEARALLERHDPDQVVASLLSLATPRPVRDPMEIVAPQPAKSGRASSPWKGGRTDEGPSRRPHRGQRRGARTGEHVRFTINWGFHGGANPRRLMAMICRRGDITSRAIGAIEPGPRSTTFEIERSAAADFESRVRRPDARDPKLVIRRA